MRTIVCISLVLCSIFISCNENGYRREPLPKKFTYHIIEDESNSEYEKNQYTVEISEKLTIGQIATLADRLFESKPKQRRFYIFYLLSNMKLDDGAWATSHFDPDLKISILGSTKQQEHQQKQVARNKIEGEVIGRWYEEQYTSSAYVLFRNNEKLILRTYYKSGQTADEKMKETKEKNGLRIDYSSGGFNGEYFILNEKGELEFYNSENKMFTKALKK